MMLISIKSKPKAPHQFLLHKSSDTPRGRGGALTFFLGGCVPRGFQNVGSRERIFLKKDGVLGTKIWTILGLESSDFGQNMLENAKIF